MRITIFLLLCLLTCGYIPSQQASESTRLFAVATIKPSAPGPAPVTQIRGNRFATEGTTLVDVFRYAYNVHPNQPGEPPAAQQATAISVEGPRQEQETIVGQNKRSVFMAQGRIRIIKPSSPLIAAESNQIELECPGGIPTKLFSDQTAYYGKTAVLKEKIAGSDITYDVHQRDGHAYIEVLPLRVGEIRIDLTGMYSDGGIAFARLLVDVAPSTKKPLRVLVGNHGRTNSGTLFLPYQDTLERANKRPLYVGAEYEGLKGLIDVRPTDVTFTVRNDKDPPAFRIDPQTGVITALHAGHGLLETTLAGTTNLTCVVITEPNFTQSVNCDDLLVREEKLSPQGLSQYELAPRKQP